MTALDQIQVAMVAKIKADTQIMAIITGAFDFAVVPVNQAFPYVALGDTTETDDSVLADIGYDTTMTLHIWSKYPGFKEARTILGHLNRLFNHKSLTLSSQHCVGIWYEFAQPLNDPNDNTLRHMPVRYRIKTQE